MKSIILKLTLTVAAIASAAGVYAQQNYGAQWGATPEEQHQNVVNYNFFKDAVNNKDYDEAIKYLPDLLSKVPKATQNLYIYAVRIYDNRILAATNMAEKNQRIDSLMMIYDMRIANFGDQPQSSPSVIMAHKVQAFMDYRPSDRAGLRTLFREAISSLGENPEINFINVYFNELTNDYKEGEIGVEEYLDEYERLEVLVNAPVNVEKAEAKNTFEALFITSGAASCENLEAMLGPKIAANPDDIDLARKALSYLSRGKCYGELFMNLAEQDYRREPTSEAAMRLALLFEDQQNFSKALEYLNAAIANETDAKTKANLAIRIAASELGNGNARTAADFARQAITNDSENELGYYMLAQAYASGSNQCSGFNRQAAYWLIYDTLQSARRYATDPERIKDIETQMASYRSGFPSQEECFFRGLSDGQSYRVSCGWVSGNTTVRQGR